LEAGAIVGGASGMAIQNNYGDSVTTVETGAAVLGNISLGGGSDNLTFAGGDFSGVTLFDGGNGLDALSFIGSSGGVAGATIVNLETVLIGAGSTISFTDNTLKRVSFRSILAGL